MGNLYGSELAKTYDEIYQGFIDYTEEYRYYASICKEYRTDNILEIACGSGNLAESFLKNFVSYVGLDYSRPMFKIAKEKCPEGKFPYGDMRNFNTDKLFNAILIKGRSTSYLLTDDDFYQTFDCVRRALQTNGVFIFDFIDANRFSPYITSNPKVVHKSLVTGKQYLRESKWKNSNRGSISLVNWTADYYSIQQTNKIFLGNETSVLRTFTLDEIKELLKTKGFKIIECFDRRTYAFGTFVVVCKKLEKLLLRMHKSLFP